MNEELKEVKQVLKLFGLEQDAEKFYNLCIDNGVDPSKALDAVKELAVRHNRFDWGVWNDGLHSAFRDVEPDKLIKLEVKQ